ncbi:MAG TPA: CRTAC1 family protein [Gammaproteobacteria bacterium]|nr:CRTAC1 family protein [Gammaproteobacteria bacterium]
MAQRRTQSAPRGVSVLPSSDPRSSRTGCTRASAAAARLLLLATFGVLAACGGGGGDGGSSGGAPPPAPPAPPAQFSNITNSTGISFVHKIVNPTNSKAEMFAGGAAAGDYDGDGDLDLYVVRGDVGPNLLYRNDGGNHFTDVAAAAGVARAKPAGGGYLQSGPVFADLDSDGDLDLFVGGLEGDPCVLFQNLGNGTFRDVTAQSGLNTLGARNTISASFGDADLDGDVDLLLAHWGTPRPPDGAGGNGNTETLWLNDGAAGTIHFTDASVASGVAAATIPRRGGYAPFQPTALDYDYSFVAGFARMDGDRYPELLIVSDFNNTRFLMNKGAQGPGAFRDATDNAVIIDRNGMGSAVGDVDNDGDLDWFVTGIFGASETVGNRLYLNQGGGLLQDVSIAAGIQDGGWGWGACLADFDLDGRLDIFHTNGWTNLNPIDDFEHDRSRLFISQPNGLRFVDAAGTRGMSDAEQGRAVICADFDRDGDVDIFMTNRGLANSGAFWLNDDKTSTNKSLTVKLVAKAPNTEAVGARIRVTIGGTTQLREIAIGGNFTSQTPTAQVFGLGSAGSADSVQIEWPDGRTDSYANVAAGKATFVE